MRLPRSRAFYVLLAMLALAVIALANAHLLIVAQNSQPHCVDHIQPGDAGATAKRFGAAKSAC